MNEQSESIQQQMVTYIRAHSEGVSSKVLAEKFLKCRTSVESVAHTAVSAILKRDHRCSEHKNAIWVPVAAQGNEPGLSLEEIPWISVFLLIDTRQDRYQILHVAISRIYPAPVELFSESVTLE